MEIAAKVTSDKWKWEWLSHDEARDLVYARCWDGRIDRVVRGIGVGVSHHAPSIEAALATSTLGVSENC